MSNYIWKTVADEKVRHVWACGNEGCKEYNREGNVGPEFYRESGTPVCPECDEDMTYIRTEIME